MKDRIRRHKESRPPEWDTFEFIRTWEEVKKRKGI